MSDIQVTNEGIIKLLQKMNPGKASGPDLLPARILKELAEELSPDLTAIFQRSLIQESYQKTGTAIFKKGEKFKASNYRPVSLTSLCCKIQEHVITSNVLKQLESYDILTDCQHGFRARRSCETRIHDIWSKTISSKRRLVECDIWSIRRFAHYDVWSTTTIGRKFVELRRNLVEIWSKIDLYRKNKNCLHLRFSHLPIFY